MPELLDSVLSAHGGLARWHSFRSLRATIVTGGALWGMKGLVQDAEPREMTVLLHEERASVMPFGEPDRRTAFTPDRIAIETIEGELVAERRDPRQSFRGHEMTTPWDPLQRAYFNGYALWTYLTTPFLLALDGVEVREVEPLSEDGESWRRLRARFPARLATHSSVQDFFFGPDFLLRRHDYSVEVAGGFHAAQLVSDYREVQGLRLPTRRRAYRRSADERPLPDPVLVSIDLSDIRFG
ncbi:hypothetical protein SAMN06265365_1712 [Tistlia consotensis]|uniref:Uncharacterized protein n=1 Tax=Tistlia consotensis USBA 355 TaxID=560819 RepID=A0A1Y6CSN6_9PROT|nr:hypothetical protein [Tistlia consotensis]SMF85694.1 hypothetical protein SAMN05428998_1692 [Tistlia consotensis USBA 355]SNS41081.1 hypothetical protein SAMN06265365_1712 [Tistlia consotensis]